MLRRIALLVAVGLALAACKTPKREKEDPGSEESPEKKAPRETDEPKQEEERLDPPEEPARDYGEVTTELRPVPDRLAARIELERVVDGLSRPLDLDFAPGDDSGRLFVTEQKGLIRILRGGDVEDRPFLDVRGLVSRNHEEQGLLGLAFHPDFADSRKLYINYTDREGDTRVVEYRVREDDADRVDPGTAREIFSVGQPWRNHNGGDLEFGPDGKLYVGTGDGGAAGDPRGAAQDRDNHLGKMLRFDVEEEDLDPELVAWGLRNPWRYAFDRKTGDLYIGDVGQDAWEWVHVAPAGEIEGKNFGWNVTEGSHCFEPRRGCDKSGITPPAVEYSHRKGCSITGGRVYRGGAIPELDRVYFYADYCTALLRSFRWTEEGVHQHWDWKPVLDPRYRLATIAAFGEDAAGELYIVSLDGVIYKLVPKD